jgi:hypothetical protein
VRKLLITTFTVAIAVAGLGACGGDDDGDAGGDTTTTADGTGPTTPSTGDARLDELVQRAREATFKVTYEAIDGVQTTVAQDPPRVAYVSGDGGLYQTEDGRAVSCSGIGDPAMAACVVLPSTSGSLAEQAATTFFGAGYAGFLAAANQGGEDVFGTIETSEEEIAGRDAQCATFDPGASPLIPATGSFTACVDVETGVVLRISGTDQTGEEVTAFRAVEFGEPTDDDLDPPAEPTEISVPTIPEPNG